MGLRQAQQPDPPQNRSQRTDRAHSSSPSGHGPTRAGYYPVLHRGMRNLSETDVDPLTGLLGPAEFRRLYEERRARSRRLGARCTVLAVRVLELPRVRAAYGPEAAEGMVQHAAGTLRRAVRSTDALAHLGRGALAALQDDGDRYRVQSIMDRLHADPDGYRPP